MYLLLNNLHENDYGICKIDDIAKYSTHINTHTHTHTHTQNPNMNVAQM